MSFTFFLNFSFLNNQKKISIFFSIFSTERFYHNVTKIFFFKLLKLDISFLNLLFPMEIKPLLKGIELPKIQNKKTKIENQQRK